MRRPDEGPGAGHRDAAGKEQSGGLHLARRMSEAGEHVPHLRVLEVDAPKHGEGRVAGFGAIGYPGRVEESLRWTT